MKGKIYRKNEIKEKGVDKYIQVFYDALNNRRITNKVKKEYINGELDRILLMTNADSMVERESDYFSQLNEFMARGYAPCGGEAVFYTRDLGFPRGENLSKYDIELLNKKKYFSTMRTKTHLLELSFDDDTRYWILTKMNFNTYEVQTLKWHVNTPFLLHLIMAEYLSHVDVITRLDSKRELHNETDWYNVPEYAANFLFTKEILSNVEKYINSIHPLEEFNDMSFDSVDDGIIRVISSEGIIEGYYDLSRLNEGVLRLYNCRNTSVLSKIEITKDSQEKDIKLFLRESCKTLGLEMSDILKEFLYRKMKENSPEEDEFSTLCIHINMNALNDIIYTKNAEFKAYIGETNNLLELDVKSSNENKFKL